jgi:hypothetical protein
MVEPRDELPIPHFERRLWGELEQRWRDRGDDAPRVAPRRRRVGRRTLLAAAVAAAAAVVLAVAVGGPPGSVPGSQPEPADASVVERVLAATGAAVAEGDSIVHETRQEVPREGPGWDYRESWYDEVTSATRHRTLTAEGEPLTDSGWPEPPAVDARPDPALTARDYEPEAGVCDPTTRLAPDAEGNLRSCVPEGTLPPQPMHDFRVVDHCRRQYGDVSAAVVRRPGWAHIRFFLESGHVVEDGRQEVDGRDLIRIRNVDGSYVVLADPETYLPVQITEQLPGEDEPTVTTYERLERTPENLALLSPEVPAGFAPGGAVGLPCTDNPAPSEAVREA